MKKWLLFILSFLGLLAGCTGGTNAGNATFVMSLSSSSVIAGGSISASSQLTSTTSKPVNNIDVTYSSNRPDLIHFATNIATNYGTSSIPVKTNSTGNTTVVLNIDNSVAIPVEGISVSIIATTSGLQSVQTLTVTAVSGGTGASVGATKVALALAAPSIQDNGGQTIATATVTDSAGTVLSDQAVTFTISPTTGPANITPINGGLTDSTGKAYATITGTTTATPQNIFVYAASSGTSTAQPLTITPTITATPTTIPKSITITTTKSSLQTSEQLILTAAVADGSGNAIANQTVAFAVQPAAGHATVTPINNGTTDSTGKAYAIVAATTATAIEQVFIYASTGTTPNTVTTASSSIQIMPPGTTATTLPASIITMSPDKQSLSPVTSSTNNSTVITTVVNDANGKSVPNENVTFSVISGPVTLVNTSAATGNDGKCYTVLQANAGTTNPTYALIRAVTTNGTSQTLPMIIAPLGKPQLTFSIAKSTIEATDSEVLATVQVLDSTGAPVNGQSVTFNVISGPASLVAGLTSVTTGADGKATTKLTPSATAFASNILLSMQMTYQGTNYSLVTTATVNPSINLTVALDTATIDTVGQIVATATAKTASGVPLPNQTVAFTITGPGTIAGQSTTTAADGTAKAIITHDATATIGNIIVEAAITSGGTTYKAYATAVPKVTNIKLTLAVQSSFTPSYSINGPLGNLTDYTTTTVDGLTPALPIKATLTYTDGTPIPNQTVTFTALDPGLFWNSTGGAANGTPITATTTTSGTAYVVAVPGNFTAPGFMHIEAKVTINGTTYKQVMPIAVQPTKIQKSLTLDKASVIISPNIAKNINATYNLMDASGNPVSGQNVTFTILSGPATVTGIPVATDGAGNANVIIQAGPNVTMRETVYVNAAVTVNGVIFNTVASFTVDPSINLALLTDVATVDANLGQVVATATLKDAAGTAISGQNVTFSILAGAATVTSAQPVSTSTSGVAMATIQTTNTNSTQNVLVQASTTYAGVTYTQVTTFQINKGIGTLVITAPPTTSSNATAPASVSWLTSISVKLLDANGKPRTNVPITLTPQSSNIGGYQIATDNAGTYASTHTVNTDSQGIAVFVTNTPTISVATAGGFQTTQVVWSATTNDPVPVIGLATSTYNLTGI